MKDKEDTYEANFAALRAKQEEARLKYAREKECKSVFADAASMAQERGLGANEEFNQEVFDRCSRGLGSFVPVPDWQAAWDKDSRKHVPVRDAAPQESAREEPEESLAVKGIDELYEFANSVEGEDDNEVEFALPSWEGTAEDPSSRPWCSQAMKDAVDNAALHNAALQREQPEQGSLAVAETESQTTNCVEEEREEEEEQGRFENVADLDIEGEVNYVRIAREAFQGIQGSAAQLSTSLQNFNARPNNARIKLQVVDDSDDSDSDSDSDSGADQAHTDDLNAPDDQRVQVQKSTVHATTKPGALAQARQRAMEAQARSEAYYNGISE